MARRLIHWLIAICLIAVALFGGRVWAAEIWGIQWIAEDGKYLIGAPEVAFPTHGDCVLFGDDRVAYAEVVAGIHITYRCVLLPSREA